MSSYEGYGDATALLALLIIIIPILIFIFVIAYVITSALLMVVFKKANVEGWKAWVPFYNTWVMFELAGYKGWTSLLLIASASLGQIPFVGWIFSLAVLAYVIIVTINFQKAFNKEWPWIFLYIFLPIVWLAIIAFDSSKYEKEKLEPAIFPSIAK